MCLCLVSYILFISSPKPRKKEGYSNWYFSDLVQKEDFVKHHLLQVGVHTMTLLNNVSETMNVQEQH